MTPEELQERCALYVLGALDPQEAEALEARLQAGDPEVVREVASLQEVVDHLPYGLPPVAPNAAVRSQLLARMQATSAATQPRPGPVTRGSLQVFRHPLLWVPSAIAALLVLLAGWWVRDLRVQIADLKAEIRHLHDVADAHQQLVALLTTPKVAIVALAGTEHAPRAEARLLWDQARGEWTVLTSGLPSLPPGKVYQLWALTAGAPIPFDTFRIDAKGMGTIRAHFTPGQISVTGAAVSLEPEGGVPQPTGNIVLAGTL